MWNFDYQTRDHSYFHVMDPIPAQDLPLYLGRARVRAGYRSDRGPLPRMCAGILVLIQGHGTVLAAAGDRPAAAGTVLWYDSSAPRAVLRADGPGLVLSFLAQGERCRRMLAGLIDRHGPVQAADPSHPLLNQATGLTARAGAQVLPAADAQALVDGWLRLGWPVAEDSHDRLRRALLTSLAAQDPVTAAARRLAVSREHFSRQVRERLGCPPRRWVADERLRQAGLMLATGDQSVAEVASAVGFASPTAFNAAFRRFHGISPGAWRRQRRWTPRGTARTTPAPRAG